MDLAKGSRFLSYGYSEDLSLTRKIGNRFFLLLVNLFWSANYTDLCYGFAAFRKNAIEKLCPHLRSTNFEIETEVFVKAKKLGLKVIEVPSVEFRRQHGKSNLSVFPDGFRILRTIFREFNEWGIDLDHTVIATPFNKAGFQMNPSREECENILSSLSSPVVIAISVLAAGYLKPVEAVNYIESLPNIKGVAVGVSKEYHARETFKLLKENLV